MTTEGKGGLRIVDAITGTLGIIGIGSAIFSWLNGPAARISALDDKIDSRLSKIENSITKLSDRVESNDALNSIRFTNTSQSLSIISNRQHEGFQRLSALEAVLKVKRNAKED